MSAQNEGRGIGRLIMESEARSEASGMMVAAIVLMLVGAAAGDHSDPAAANILLRWQSNEAT